MDIYEVGGAVRDQLLGLQVRDRDWVVVGSNVDEMLAAGYRQVGRDFPVFLHPDSGEEYALARTERKSGHGYTGFVVHAAADVTLEQDLQRRDLSINAMARGSDGKLVDPFGGRADIEARQLRHVSPAFREDPLRVLRVARFAARFARLGFEVAPETLALMRDIAASGELSHLIAERVWQEWQLALQTSNPSTFLAVLQDCNALQALFGELESLWKQPAQAFANLDRACVLSDDTEVRFAALLLGCSDIEAIRALCKRLRVPNNFRDLALLGSQHHWRCNEALNQTAEALLDTLETLDALRRPDRFAQWLLACEAALREGDVQRGQRWPPALRLQAALAAARSIDAASIAACHREPAALIAAIRSARCAAIQAIA
ncbi:MAG TPA: multifunctional CCA tRNA nucleotidyl transferase/2'3'-cyclic phosphodiesterase/2'nucleotidase/phosphatase [Pseudomonadaceae bacterium]|nr:multifunctional CCA tRNA nucleotidyl transferase/2'3'-cyclic phosphodiesterase/2'nucleotidase/phosphatase [Pseudomonadaceae bacterium]